MVVEQFEATSTDGTKVPYFIVHKKGIALDGTTPTIMTAYGGFEVSMTPGYSAITGKLWLERGGSYVLANIRGGGEFGPAWHDAGRKTKRQIIYDDFASVAKDLFARKLTSADKLGIYGGSNGGLLMGVEFNQHPDLWKAVTIQVPLLDMIRYEQIAAGASWVDEYGSVKNPEERAFLEKDLALSEPEEGRCVPRALHLDDDQGRPGRTAACAQVRGADEGIWPALPLLRRHRGRAFGRRRYRTGRAAAGTADDVLRAEAARAGNHEIGTRRRIPCCGAAGSV